MSKDHINPDHYKRGGIETFDYIQAKSMSYAQGNVIKYVSRYQYKNGLEDLQKAMWYLHKLIIEEEAKLAPIPFLPGQKPRA